jgi:modulator of FtsH protease HflK
VPPAPPNLDALPPRPGGARGVAPARSRVRKVVWLMLGAAAALYLLSGIYFVQPNERAVVRQFGRIAALDRSVPPGLHYALPWPLARVDRPKTTDIRRVFVGLPPSQRDAIARGDAQAMAASPASDILTGDVNILKVTMAVQYQVADPAAYVCATVSPDRLVFDAVQGAMLDLLAVAPVDEALTTGKVALQNDTLARSQALLDQYSAGVRLIAANVETIEPPQAIVTTFKDVASARQDAAKAVDRSRAESDRTVARARGDAAQSRESAASYSQTRVSRARGEADRFLAMLTEYRRAPQVTRDRLRIQTFERLLGKVRTYILDNQPGEPPANLRIIEPGRR